jgi:hypothetical protein
VLATAFVFCLFGREVQRDAVPVFPSVRSATRSAFGFLLSSVKEATRQSNLITSQPPFLLTGLSPSQSPVLVSPSACFTCTPADVGDFCSPEGESGWNAVSLYFQGLPGGSLDGSLTELGIGIS